MPSYDFDVHDDESELREGGIDRGESDIPAEARNLLRLLAYAKAPTNRRSMLVTDVGNEGGEISFHASVP